MTSRDVFLGTQQQRQMGLHQIAHLKEPYFSEKKNKVQAIFDNTPDNWKATFFSTPV